MEGKSFPTTPTNSGPSPSPFLSPGVRRLPPWGNREDCGLGEEKGSPLVGGEGRGGRAAGTIRARYAGSTQVSWVDGSCPVLQVRRLGSPLLELSNNEAEDTGETLGAPFHRAHPPITPLRLRRQDNKSLRRITQVEEWYHFPHEGHKDSGDWERG